MFKAMLLDNDGTLMDSEYVHYLTNRNVFARYGLDLTEDMYIHYYIDSSQGSPILCKIHNIDLNAIRREKKSEWEILKSGVKPMEGAADLIDRLYQKYVLAIVSYASKYTILDSLDNIGRRDKIAHIVSNEDVENQKPHPEPYIKAISRVKCMPNECLAFEDSGKGVLSAYAAGVPCIGIPNGWTKNNDFTKAIKLVKSLNDITLDMIRELELGFRK